MIRAADVILVSAVYFAIVGLVMGGFVGDLVGASVGGLLTMMAPDTKAHPPFVTEKTFRPLWIGLAFVLWLVTAWALYIAR